MKKIVATIISLLAIIAVFRYVAVERYKKIHPERAVQTDLSIETVLEYMGDTVIYDFNYFYQDINGLTINFTSLTNALTAEAGQDYTIYEFHFGSPPQGTNDDLIIENIYGGYYGYFTEETQSKPGTGSNLWENIQYIGSFIAYILNMLVTIGAILFDIIGSLIVAIKNIIVFVYNVLFRVDFSIPI